MEGFTYTDIFETKGIEYLVIIAFLLLIIPFWYMLTRRKTSAEAAHVRSGLVALADIKIPGGIFFSRNHSWAYLESNGLARLGIDDFISRVAGNLSINVIRGAGTDIKKGELLAEAIHKGRKLKIVSPVSGRIKQINEQIHAGISSDPYGKGWLCKVVPADWKKETGTYMLGAEAGNWIKNELERFRDMVASFVAANATGTPQPVLQDGGELRGYPLSEMPEEAWAVFEKTFLNLEVGT